MCTHTNIVCQPYSSPETWVHKITYSNKDDIMTIDMVNTAPFITHGNEVTGMLLLYLETVINIAQWHLCVSKYLIVMAVTELLWM